jgi:hypothetical protein
MMDETVLYNLFQKWRIAAIQTLRKWTNIKENAQKEVLKHKISTDLVSNDADHE